MNLIANHLLTLILFTPTLVAAVLVFLPQEEEKLIRWAAFVGRLDPSGALDHFMAQFQRKSTRLPV